MKTEFARRHRMAHSASLAAIMLAFGSTNAAAQQTTPVDEELGSGDIVVTAQKRDERLKDVPQSVTALSSDDIERLAASQLRDFANTVPGLSVATAGAGYSQVTVRGVTAGFDIGPTVGTYVDEVPYGSSSAFANGARATLDVGLFDTQRIEVLRGPQGTLYGASSMGGLIKYVTRLPDTGEHSAELRAGVAATEHGGVSYDGSAVINVPLSPDKAAVRASAYYSHDGGYVDNLALSKEDVNRSNIYGGRLDFLLTPTDRFSIRIGAFVQHIERGGIATVDYSPAGEPIDGSLDQRRLIDEPYRQRFGLGSAVLNYEFDGAKLTSVSSYQTARMNYEADVSVRFVPLFANFFQRPYSAVGLREATQTRKFTQEIRLASAGNTPLEWVIGGFYTNEKSDRSQVLAPRAVGGGLAPFDLLNFASPTRYREYAAFGDLTWHVTDRFDITGGLRYARNKQVYEQIGTSALGLIGSQPESRSSESVTTYLANARYRFSDRVMAYARFATGYRPGGPNFQLTDPTTGLPIGTRSFEADRLKSYEIGVKADTADRVFGIDISAYYIDWSNIQILVRRGPFSGIGNAPGGASVRGVEAALTLRPVSGVRISGNAAYQDAHLSEADTDLLADKGERLPNVPRLTSSLSADYSFGDGDAAPFVGATVRYVGARNVSFDRSTSPPQYRLPPYAAVDLRGGFQFGGTEVQLYVRNLFDRRGQYGYPSPIVEVAGPRPVSTIQPRTFGVMLKMAL